MSLNAEYKKYLSRLAATNSFKQLMSLSPPNGQQFSVVAYFIIDPPTNGRHGMWMHLGYYSSAKKAQTKAQQIIEQTGHPGVIVSPSCSWQYLDENPNNIKRVDTDVDGTLRSQHAKLYQQELARIRQREQIESSIEHDQEQSLVPTTIEHYTQNWYLTVRNFAAVEHYRKMLADAEQAYQKRVELIQQQYAQQPEFDTTWLPILKSKLAERGEDNVFELITQGYDQLKSSILSSGPNSTDC